MSDLQIGLVALGVACIVLVLALNWWQDFRVRRKMQAHFQGSEQDPLLGAEPAGGARREPGFEAPPVLSGPDADDPEEPDPVSEAVIEVNFGTPAPGADLLAYLPKLGRAGGKPIRFFAQTEGQRHRARVHAGESYASAQLAVLLANRAGPLTAIEWSQAWALAQDLADHFEGAVEGPDQQAALAQAARLDDTCAALDTQVGLTLELSGARPAGELIAAARELGFMADGARLIWPAGEGAARFALTRADGAPLESGMMGIDRLSLLLDVPRSAADEQAFSRMVEAGGRLAEKMGAQLVDDHGKPLAPGAAGLIDEKLRALFTQLEQAGLPAGGERALRVFS